MVATQKHEGSEIMSGGPPPENTRRVSAGPGAGAFAGYRFVDYFKATLLAPLLTIPATFLWFSLASIVWALLANGLDHEIGVGFTEMLVSAAFMDLFALPTAYLGTMIFGTLGTVLAHLFRYRFTVLSGAVLGLACGALMGSAWLMLLFPAGTGIRGNAELIAFYFPVALLSGLMVGIEFVLYLRGPHYRKSGDSR